MQKYARYLWYVVRHKYYVTVECFKRGLFWRGLMHDMSKLGWSEFFAYMNWFSDDEFSALKKRMDDKLHNGHVFATMEDLSDNREMVNRQEAFDAAWLHHQHCNPHHWQYWVLREDDGGTSALPMPYQYALEMFCDWVGAGLAITGKRDVAGWYARSKDKMILHIDTRHFIEELIAAEVAK